jgi:hypothetical protein
MMMAIVRGMARIAAPLEKEVVRRQAVRLGVLPGTIKQRVVRQADPSREQAKRDRFNFRQNYDGSAAV